MTRTKLHLAWVACAAVPIALITGQLILAVAMALPAAALVVWARRSVDREPDGWPRQLAATGPPSGTPTRDEASSPARGVARALGRVEARELAVSPLTGIGLAFGAVMLLSFAPSYDGHESWGDIVQDLPFLAHAMVGMTVLAAFAAATRGRRHGVEELVATCPTSARTRTLAQLMAAWVPAVTLVAWAIAYLLIVDRAVPTVAGPLGSGAVATILTAGVLGAGGVALGVLIGRWTTNPVAPVAVIVGIGVLSPRLADGDGELVPRMLFSTMTGLNDSSPILTAGQAWLHLLCLVALTIATAAAALAGRR